MTLQKQTFDKIRQIVDRFPSELELACEEIDANTMLLKTKLKTDEVEEDDCGGVPHVDYGQSSHLSSAGSLIVFTVWESWSEFDKHSLEINAKLEYPNEFLEENIRAAALERNFENPPVLQVEDQTTSCGYGLLNFLNGEKSTTESWLQDLLLSALFDNGLIEGEHGSYFLLDESEPIKLS